MVDRTVNKEAGTCSSSAVIPKKNLSPRPATGGNANVNKP